MEEASSGDRWRREKNKIRNVNANGFMQMCCALNSNQPRKEKEALIFSILYLVYDVLICRRMHLMHSIVF
jgi:hypothetical protein